MDPYLMQQLNRQQSFETMIPLTEFSDAETVHHLREQGYYTPYTVDSWKKDFSDIDPKYILCSQALVTPSYLYYYDAEHLDINMLRTKTSKHLVPVAYQLVNAEYC